jgi:hypothetical protein
MTSRALFIIALLLSTAAWAACRNVEPGDDDPSGDQDASTDTDADTDADTDTDTFTDGLTRVYGDLSGGTGYCCGESASEDPVHVSLTKRMDDCDPIEFPTDYGNDFDMGEAYEIILEEGGCYELWANDASYFYCSADIEDPIIVVVDGGSYRYDINLTCCCDEE